MFSGFELVKFTTKIDMAGNIYKTKFREIRSGIFRVNFFMEFIFDGRDAFRAALWSVDILNRMSSTRKNYQTGL